MCDMCDGATIEELIERDAAKIARHGYTLQAVTGNGRDDDPRSWVYTMGLLDLIGHPEMIIAGADVRIAASVLVHLAEWAIEDDEWFAPEDVIELDAGDADVGAVHAVHYGRNRGTFNMWYTLKSAGILHTRRLEAVQIIVPSALSAFGERSWQPDLSRPDARV
jgi:hypothetical protein